MAANTYFYYPFAEGASDNTPIPITAPVDGSISYQSGYGPDYELNLLTNPAAIPVGRTTMNQLFFDITTQLQLLSQYGAPQFITTAQNQGTPFPYPIYAEVYYSGVRYQNQVAGNTVTPGVDDSWFVISGNTSGGGIQSQTIYTSGSGTYTVPANIQVIKVECVGGGGGAISLAGSNQSGGGSGAYCSSLITVVPGQTISYAVGAGGIGTRTSSTSGSGAATTFGALSAGGGGGGTSTVPGSGGTASGGTLNINGNPGSISISGSPSIGGMGGSSYFGGAGLNGGAGSSGGGGSGTTVSGNFGGNGGTGIIIITEFS